MHFVRMSRLREAGSKSYTASSDAGPSNTAVIPSTVTVAVSLATYLESPLLYSFPEQHANIWSVKHHFDTTR